MGHRVVALSRTEEKRQESIRLGANDFFSGETVPEGDCKLDWLLVTTSAHPPWQAIIKAMAPCATIVLLDVDEADLRIP